MDLIKRFLEYAEAFEKTYEDDDWSRLEAFFTEDASYQFGDQRADGRTATLEMLRGSVDGLDRQMDSRTVDFDAPTTEGNTVHMDWKVTYTKTGCPDLVISGHENAVFDGDRIKLLRDEMAPGAEAALNAWIADHGSKLGG
ncbi:MAG: nuclear transport factor 2 family protein [Pseudomonadales bacterium]